MNESSVVHINCSHDDDTYPIMLWYQQREDRRALVLIGSGYGMGDRKYEGQFEEEFEMTRRDTVTGALVVRRASPSSHSAVYFCAAAAKAVTFQQARDKIVNETDRAVIQCSHDNDDFYVMLWYQKGGDGQLSLMGHSYDRNAPEYEPQFKDKVVISRENRQTGALILRSVNVSDAAVYFCAATYFGSGTKLTVLEPNRTIEEPKVKLFPPSERECQNKRKKKNKKTLVCLAFGFYPDHVTMSWQINGHDVTNGVATEPSARRHGDYYNITSLLMIPLAHWYSPGTNFTCIVNFFNGEKIVPYPKHVIGVDGPGAQQVREKYMSITQNAKLSYVVLIFKSCVYGLSVAILGWMIQGSLGKQND
ncbi:T cell receptor beta chain MC.7.G5-like [Mugil cephalus]|uniref:T cell receptor beta chain MC.7.G5-like n=1 Tax=Mugil cephalus TaxID=48193 RepID=UPI001FB7F008|nr:T cell receptor beta chain MC.7.G5-like [Mugil cephalus]